MINATDYIKLESGKEYSLSDILTENNKIIIPDLQRDYCWGDKAWDEDAKAYKELVSGFLESLISSFNEKPGKDLTMGLIYGYESPRYHIQLCDGQQRLTTLFLLLGILNRRTDEGYFGKCLISDIELNRNDKEPHLQYSIRESTLYFLSDLVCHFFLDKKTALGDIRKQDWYFSDYDLDATIQSMLAALGLIESKLNEHMGLDVQVFGDYIVHNLKLLYYDMGGRKNGEETFVVINTTGEPLTATENLKPILITSLPKNEQNGAARKWEDWEQFFWLRRGDHIVSDIGFREFIRWVLILDPSSGCKKAQTILKEGKYTETETRGLSFDTVAKYFDCTEWLFGNILTDQKQWLAPSRLAENKQFALSQIDCFVLLPLIEYVKLYGQDNIVGIQRLRHFLENMTRSVGVTKNINDCVPQAIELIRKLHDIDPEGGDIAQCIGIESVSTVILTDEEREKFILFLDSSYDREALERRFREAEVHKVLDGEIQPLLRWATAADGKFDINLFGQYYSHFNTIFKAECDFPELDITRRALLSYRLNNYPRIFKGYTNFSFCWDFSDWKTLIMDEDNIEKTGNFIRDLVNSGNIYERMQQMIDDYPEAEDWAEFIKIPELIGFCEQKLIQNHNNTWFLIHQGNARHQANIHTYKLFLDLAEESWGDWKLDFYDEGETCAYFDLSKKQCAIDVYYAGKNDPGDESFYLQIFRRVEHGQPEDTQTFLSAIASAMQWEWNGKRYQSEAKGRTDIIEYIHQAMTAIENG